MLLLISYFDKWSTREWVTERLSQTWVWAKPQQRKAQCSSTLWKKLKYEEKRKKKWKKKTPNQPKQNKTQANKKTFSTLKVLQYSWDWFNDLELLVLMLNLFCHCKSREFVVLHHNPYFHRHVIYSVWAVKINTSTKRRIKRVECRDMKHLLITVRQLVSAGWGFVHHAGILKICMPQDATLALKNFSAECHRKLNVHFRFF